MTDDHHQLSRTKLILQAKEVVNGITGEIRRVAWFDWIRIVHKRIQGADHTDESCWCHPIVTKVQPSDR